MKTGLRGSLVLTLVVLGAVGQSGLAWSVQGDSARFAGLVAKWEAFERHEFPETATLRGYHEADDRLTDVSDAAVFRRRRFVTALLAEISTIDRAALTEQEQISRELLMRQLAQKARIASLYGKLPFGAFESDSWIPFSSLDGPHSLLVQLAQASRFSNRRDYENYLARLDQVPDQLRNLLRRMESAINAGWIAPGAPMERVPEQLSGFATAAVASGPLMSPFSGPHQGVDEAGREALAARARRVLTRKVAPAFAEAKRFLEQTYLPAARAAPLSASRLPAGKAYYDALTNIYTTTSDTPEQIHRVGQREVARVSTEIKRILDSTGFTGTLRQFVVAKRADPAQRFESSEAMLVGYRDIAKRADAELPRLFATLPRLPYGIRAMAKFEGDNAERYVPGSADGQRAGFFMANVNRLDRRGRFEMEALLLHETVPGHHLQIARAMEIDTLPEFRRHLWITAYGEGWALYAESLGGQMGLYETPESKINYLSSEIWRAARLVVDTGLHRLDWTRRQAIDYLVDTAGVEAGFAAAEVDRYISIPGQALAYKMGELKIKALRAKAQAQLGVHFDLRRFHDAVLDDGPLPLDVLEQRINSWIQRERARAVKTPGFVEPKA
ncbi:MAG: hypothetical protein A3G25_10110 [Betaproteobacteria bacterium RIFCSPLOWO2_12_FULL_63_13]|nr:MAG: hypothetical protein A3G25_10110 [Betaproteobacteria bacterium RIFCSPLOWO2_12_FULL_63_13]